MTGSAPDLARLGRALARRQDAELGRVALRTRERLLESPPGPTFVGRARLRWALGSPWRTLSLAAAAALLVAIGISSWRPAPVTFVVGESASVGATDDWLAAPETAPLPIRFSDGSTLTLSARSRARVVATSADGATVVVERGRVEADVVHRPGARWGVRVGPYELRVLGTRFAAAWDPELERLRVDLAEGSIEVRGPGLGRGRPMGAGTRLEAYAAAGRVDLVPLDPEALVAAEGRGADATSESAPLGGGATEPRADGAGGAQPTALDGPLPRGPGDEPSARSPVRGPSWRALFQAGRHREALARARADGFERICREADAADLMALADSARFGGSPGHAVTALHALRTRFPSDGRASVAAFLLGTIAFDHAGNLAEATRWLELYLAEQPQGALGREAMGRLLEAAARGEDRIAVQAAARRYLAAYPGGPHGEQARRMLGDAPAGQPGAGGAAQ